MRVQNSAAETQTRGEAPRYLSPAPRSRSHHGDNRSTHPHVLLDHEPRTVKHTGMVRCSWRGRERRRSAPLAEPRSLARTPACPGGHGLSPCPPALAPCPAGRGLTQGAVGPEVPGARAVTLVALQADPHAHALVLAGEVAAGIHCRREREVGDHARGHPPARSSSGPGRDVPPLAGCGLGRRRMKLGLVHS